VYQKTIRQTLGSFVGELPEKLNNKATIKVHTGGSQTTIASGPFA
jgi:hypothetical protein